MSATRNATHLGVLAIWATFGVLYTVGALTHSAYEPLTFWVWFACFAAVMTAVAMKFTTAVNVLLAHAAAIIVMCIVPKAFPFSLVRLGLDLLANR